MGVTAEEEPPDYIYAAPSRAEQRKSTRFPPALGTAPAIHFPVCEAASGPGRWRACGAASPGDAVVLVRRHEAAFRVPLSPQRMRVGSEECRIS